jgi:Tfp pilus assembly protein PilV
VHLHGHIDLAVASEKQVPKAIRKRQSRGFSLMEILVAFMLGLLAVLTLAGLFPTGIVSIQQSSDSVQSQAIAQAYMDYIREYYQTETRLPTGFPASGTNFSCTPGSLQPLVFRGVTQQQMTFTCQYTYKNVSLGATPEHQIIFTISWSSPQRGAESRTYEEYVIN